MEWSSRCDWINQYWEETRRPNREVDLFTNSEAGTHELMFVDTTVWKENSVVSATHVFLDVVVTSYEIGVGMGMVIYKMLSDEYKVICKALRLDCYLP